MISIIIPCHNCAEFVDRAIHSILRQSYKDTEVILVNNNSSDNTLEILESYALINPGKISVLDEKKSGAPAARNAGLKKARGEWIQFLDADDELMPDKLDHQLSVAIDTRAEVVAGECVLIYHNNGKPKEIIRHVDNDVWRGLINSNLGITSANLWLKRSLNAIEGWDEEVTSSQEYDLLFRLLKNKAVIIPDHVINTKIYFSNNSVSKSSDKNKLKNILDNRVALRMKIKAELVSLRLITPELQKNIDDYIYMEIMRNYYDIPEYAKSLLRIHQFKIHTRRSAMIKSKMLVRRLLAKIMP